MSEKKYNRESSTSSTGAKKRPKKRRGFNILISAVLYLMLVLGISMLLAGGIIVSANEAFALVKPDKAIVVDIPENADISEIGNILDDAGVINYKFVFKTFSKLVIDEGDEFKPGKYELNSNMDYRSILNTLRRASTYKETVVVTIPEGYTVSQIADLLDEKMVCAKSDFLKACTDANFDDYSDIKDLEKGEHRMEGYLFPDTYEFYKNDSPENVIKKFLSNFTKKVDEDIRNLAKKKDMPIEDVLTVASLIEREAMLASEQETISGVIWNRVNNPSKFPYLQIDATVQYAVGHKEKLTQDDLEVDDPYNTYKYKGLPPGPICNPGKNAIIAALNPEDHNYYYYVAKPDGSHIFSKTLDEHNAARAKVAEMKNDEDEDE